MFANMQAAHVLKLEQDLEIPKLGGLNAHVAPFIAKLPGHTGPSALLEKRVMEVPAALGEHQKQVLVGQFAEVHKFADD